MARILSHPFRLVANGSVATVEQDSEQADREQIAVLALTVTGERALVPNFGVTDPTFAGFEAAELRAGVATFGPPVTITDVRTTMQPDDTELVEVDFE